MTVDYNKLFTVVERISRHYETSVEIEIFAYICRQRVLSAKRGIHLELTVRGKSRQALAVRIGYRIEQKRAVVTYPQIARHGRQLLVEQRVLVDMVAAGRIDVHFLQQHEVVIAVRYQFRRAVDIRLDDVFARRLAVLTRDRCAVLHLSAVHKEREGMIVRAEAHVVGHDRIFDTRRYCLGPVIFRFQHGVVGDPLVGETDVTNVTNQNSEYKRDEREYHASDYRHEFSHFPSHRGTRLRSLY